MPKPWGHESRKGSQTHRTHTQSRTELLGVRLTAELNPKLRLDSPKLTLTAAQRDEADFRMAAYAGIVDRLDQNVGRLIAYLEESGQLENTLPQ